MNFIQGFVLAVPTANREAYVRFAEGVWTMFQKYGALRMVEAWGQDVPDGTLTSFPRAVQLQPGETVVLAWIEWPDRDTAMRCHASIQNDPDWDAAGRPGDRANLPFDGRRMIFGDFVPLLDLRAGRRAEQA